MIKSLKKRFIVVAMTAVSVLLVVLLGAINVFNIVLIDNQTDRTLQFLSQQNMTFKDGKPQDFKFERFPDEPKDIFKRPMDEDTFMASRHFNVYLGDSSEIKFVDVSRISSVDENEAKEITKKLIADKKFYGYHGNFKYTAFIADSVSENTEYSSVMIFLDVSEQYQNIFSVLILSFGLGAVAWLLMLLLVVLMSQRAIKPIAENMQQQKQFITNAGHEIKTPLAIILANTDALELHNGENKWSQNIRTQTNRLSGLMQNLLLLSKFDEGVFSGEKEEINVKTLLYEVIEGYAELANNGNKTITVTAEELVIKGNRESIFQLFNILVDNAVKYAVPHSSINVSLIGNGKMILKIKNKCEKLPDVEPDKLFGRFYRGDAARTQSKGGYGIGLSVASAIADGCGGKIKSEYLDDNFIEFTIII